jgi:hypothetical protein
MDQKPNAGGIVHYVEADGGPCLAAIITQVAPPAWKQNAQSIVGLRVFAPDGDRVIVLREYCYECGSGGVAHDNGPAPDFSGDSWHWPERAD